MDERYGKPQECKIQSLRSVNPLDTQYKIDHPPEERVRRKKSISMPILFALDNDAPQKPLKVGAFSLVTNNIENGEETETEIQKLSTQPTYFIHNTTP